MNVPSVALPALKDVQSDGDDRGLHIDRVGIRGISYPIRVLDRAHGLQNTVGEISLAVSLAHDVRGTHMSRFVEALERHRMEMTIHTLPSLLDDLKAMLNADAAEISVSFPYFLTKCAPVSGKTAMMDYRCAFTGVRGSKGDRFTMTVVVPVATLCPCSKEISDYGAHNQRGYVSVEVLSSSFRDEDLIWIEEVVDWVEASASTPLYPLLKRVDERYVTMQAYDNPRFVEDVVREVGLRLMGDLRVAWFHVKAENMESIHNHSAFAEIEWAREVAERS